MTANRVHPLAEKMAQLQPKNHNISAYELSKMLREALKLTVQESEKTTQQTHVEPATGQVWMKKKAPHRIVKITDGSKYSTIRYVVIDGSRGQKTGGRYANYFVEDFVFLANTTDEWLAQKSSNAISAENAALRDTDERDFTVSWEINEEAQSAREAAENVWRNTFGRDPECVGFDDACVFSVTDTKNDTVHQIDLSDETA